MMKQLATIIMTLTVSTVLFFGISFWMCYVILDIIHLFTIPYFINLTMSQVFAIIVILAIARMKTDNTDKSKESIEETAEETMIKAIGRTISGSLTILFIWGLCYIAKYLLS